ncbi:saccharopine dehydrogenase NADP-binding domain-containing protein [Candidatus Bathyarchaeota archaeon]|nr:saccharopine dehydrogenase NADP-binding domain-containing protein [Candidatus Bathyarchaeota archaeon]
MKILVIGCGNIGFVAARDLAENLPSTEVVLADVDKVRVSEAAFRINRQNVSWIRLDASNKTELTSTLKDFDLAVGALPGSMGYQVCKAAIAAKTDLVDVSYMPEDVMTLNKEASRAGVSLLPDYGLSPGLGNILAGHAISKLDSVESVHMLNGGLPEKPLAPLGYVITWSVNDLIDMYNRKVNIVKSGKTVQVEPLSGLEEIEFPGVGRLEAFYTDGLRTLLYTVKGCKDMWEKTLRYPGHVEKIKLLKTLGFFQEKPVQIGEIAVSPKEVTARLFEKGLKKKDVPDIVVMCIQVTGKQNGKPVMFSYYVFESVDKKLHVTAMARTTAYTTSAATQLVARGMVAEKGVIPPETLGMNERLCEEFMHIMKAHKVTATETKKTLQ